MHASHSRNLPTIDTAGAVALSRRNGAEHAPLTAAAAYAIESASYYDRLPQEQDDGYTSPSGSMPYDTYGHSQGRRFGSMDSQAAYGGIAYDSMGYGEVPVEQTQYRATAQYDSIPISVPASSSGSLGTGGGPMLYDPDYVIAMHDFAPGTPSAACLSFKAGEVIHVLNRDPTGWWDGELDGRRGWFPSNYISTDAAAFAAAAELAGMQMPASSGEQEMSIESSVSSAGRQSPRKNRSRRSGRPSSPLTTDMSDMSESVVDRRGSCPPMMVPMVHALALLQNAVKANRVAHFQPSTACIISCVRSVLSTCECLNKDSLHLARYPKLAQQRKKVLSELAHLVGKARQASENGQAHMQNSAGMSDSESHRAPPPTPDELRELQNMVRVGDQVYAHVRKFLAIAVESGVDLPPDRMFAGAPGLEGTSRTGPVESSEDDRTAHSEPQGNGFHSRTTSSSQTYRDLRSDDESHSSASEADIPRRIRESTSNTYRPGDVLAEKARTRETTYRPGDVHSKVQLYEESTPEAPTTPSQSRIRERKTSSQKRLSFRGVSGTPPGFQRSSPRDATAPYRKPKYSVSSVSSLSSYDSSHPGSENSSDLTGPSFPAGPCPTPQALAALRITHDRLLSVIAAFIGHIHSHSRSSHASSKGHLIEMTRKTVDQVRHLLTLVDAVEEHPTIGDIKPREISMLKASRIALYKATNEIVEAVRLMMAPFSSLAEEEEKRAALQGATSTLRAGGDCVKAVNMCLSTKLHEEPFTIHIASVPSTDSPTQTRTTSPQPSSSRASSSPPSTPKSLESGEVGSGSNFKRSHSYSKSQPYNVATTKSSNEEPLPSSGSRVKGHRRRAQSDVSPMRSQATGKSIDMTEAVPEDVDEDQPEGEDTVRFGKGRGRPSLPSQSRRRTSQTLETSTESETEDDEADYTSVPAVVVSDDHQTQDLFQTQDADLAKLSLKDDFQSSRSSLDVAQAHDGPLSISSETSSSYAVSGEQDDEPGSTIAPSTSTASPTDDQPVDSLEDKLLRGHLPATPSAPAEFADAVYDPRDLLVNDSQQVIAASLDVMVIKLAPHTTTTDRAFALAFLLTFRLFTTPSKFVDALVNRWNAQPGSAWPVADREEFDSNLPFMRVRVARCIKMWLDQFWIPDTDDEVLPQLQQLLDQPLPPETDVSLKAIVGNTRNVVHGEVMRARRGGARPMDRTKLGTHLFPNNLRDGELPPPGGEVPAPLVKRTVTSRLGTMDGTTPVTDLEPLEVARQLTLMEARLFNSVPARELVELGKSGAKADHVKAISTFSTATTGWVSESILNEQDQKKRATLVKYYIKLADRCVGLGNYSTMRAVLAALDSSTISRLTKTWSHLSAKYKVLLDSMRRLSDHAKNYAVYRETLRQTSPPAVPFLGLYLTDLTFCREGNPSYRPSPLDPERQLINFIKYSRLARIVQDVQRFQGTAFSLQPVPEIQRYLSTVIEKSQNTGDLQDLYRRSLVLEPRQASDLNAPESKPGLLGWASRS